MTDYGQTKISNIQKYGDHRVQLNYDRASHSIRGCDVKEYYRSDNNSIKDAFRKAKQSIEDRQGKRGFTTIVNSHSGSSSDEFREMLEVFKEDGDQTPIFYVDFSWALPRGEKIATENEMKTWLKERGNRSLIIDVELAAGWEDSTVIAIEDGYGRSLDNMCLRAVSSLHVIKKTEDGEKTGIKSGAEIIGNTWTESYSKCNCVNPTRL